MPENSRHPKAQRPYKPAKRAGGFPPKGKETQHFIYGINAVESLLESDPLRIHRIILKKNSGNPRLYELQKKAKKSGIHTQQLDSQQLDKFNTANQGVVAMCHERALNTWEECFTALSAESSDTSTNRKIAVVAAHIEDPRNLGAVMRSALALGAECLLLPAKSNCGITPATAKTSAGASEKLLISRPTSLEDSLDSLRKEGFQILGLEADGESTINKQQYSEKVVLIAGGEDAGIPPYLRKQCDSVLRIPMCDSAHSFNTSVALSLALWEVFRSSLD